MNEVQRAWKAYLAERPGIDPGHVPEDGSGHYMLFGRNYQLFREGWDRGVMRCTNLLQGISFKQEGELENIGFV